MKAKTPEEIIAKVMTRRKENGLPDVKFLGVPRGVDNKVSVSCCVCGHGENGEWNASPSNLMVKGCPMCSRTKTSHFERFLRDVFSSILGPHRVLSRNHDAIGKELDVYLPEYNLAFEPGSWNFHKNKKVVETDKEKLALCKNNGITLVRVLFHVHPEDKIPHGDRHYAVRRGGSLGSLKGHILSYDTICFNESSSCILFRQAAEFIRCVCQALKLAAPKESDLFIVWANSTNSAKKIERVNRLNRIESKLDEHPQFELLDAEIEVRTDGKRGQSKVKIRCTKHGSEHVVTEQALTDMPTYSGCPGCPRCDNRRQNLFRKMKAEIQNPNFILDEAIPSNNGGCTMYAYHCARHPEEKGLSAKMTITKYSSASNNSKWCPHCKNDEDLMLARHKNQNPNMDILAIRRKEVNYRKEKTVPVYLVSCAVHGQQSEINRETLRKYTTLSTCPKCTECTQA